MSIAEIVEVLGGKRTFTRPIRKADDLVAQVRAGLPASTITMLADVLSLQRAQVARRLNIPSRTLSRRLATKSRLTHEESDRTLRMATRGGVGDKKRHVLHTVTSHKPTSHHNPHTTNTNATALNNQLEYKPQQCFLHLTISS